MDNAIEIEGLSKLYRRGAFGVASLREELQLAVSRRGAADSGRAFYALQDVSFSVPVGSICALVGANGSGKTTLMKILASITDPTAGRAMLRGRVGSLLEVGAGFDPELNGLENIYLNGAILGMGRSEIRRKLDQIVSFANIGPVLETPVKRYSSGMYVRLAFAVAAHLDAEILLVDEVLAVGDAEFQRKCVAAMRTLADEGRTIVFVSHNMSTVAQLCDRAVHLEGGRLICSGQTSAVIESYVLRNAAGAAGGPMVSSGGLAVRIGVEDETHTEAPVLAFGRPCRFWLRLEPETALDELVASITLSSEDGLLVSSLDTLAEGLAPFAMRGPAELVFNIDELRLTPGRYFAGCSIRRLGDDEPLVSIDALCAFEVEPALLPGALDSYGRRHGLVRLATSVALQPC